MEYKQVRIDSLKPHPKNPRVHPDSALNKLQKSIKEFGWTNPILVSKDGYILAGHARCKAAQLAGIEEVPAIFLDLEGAKADAYLIADNKIQEETDWDMEVLKDLLEELKLEDFDVTLTGFEMDDIEAMLNMGEDKEVEEDDFNADEALENIKEPISKRGDIWLLKNHRLMCGDSTSESDVSVLMDGKKADMVFTDPPYGVSYKNNMNDKFEVIKNDDTFLDIIPILKRFSKENIHWYIWTSHQVYPVWRDMFEQYYKNTIIWYKHGGAMGDLEGNYLTNYEMCLFCHFGRKELVKRECAVWDISKDNGAEYVHPTQKPIQLTTKACNNSSKKGDIILDLFSGSMSMIMGAEQTGRIGYAMELDEKYVDVGVNRYINYKNSSDDVFLIRDGKKIKYSEVVEM